MDTQSETAALVLFSGGQDSATSLAWALSRFERVETLGFDYGQRHAIELECRAALIEGLQAIKPEWKARLGEAHTLAIPTRAGGAGAARARGGAGGGEGGGRP